MLNIFEEPVIKEALRQPLAWTKIEVKTEERTGRDTVYRKDAIDMINMLADKMDAPGQIAAEQFIAALKMLRNAG